MNYICCDVDGTLTNFEKFVLEYGAIFLKKFYHLSDLDINFEGYDLDEVFINERLELFFYEKYGLSTKDVLDTFWNYYYIFYVSKKLKNGSSKFFSSLCEKDRLLITTSRKKSMDNSLLGSFVRGTIIAQLKLNFIPYEKVCFFENDEDKLEYIKKIKPVLVFDDKTQVIDELIADGEKVVCIDSSYNKKCNINALRISRYDDAALFAVKELRRM